MKKIKITDLLIFIVGTELVGVLSGILAGGSFSFYKEIVRPPFSPPGWIFPIVWIILYALMGISAYLIYTSKATVRQKNFALAVYAIQLVVNFLWSIVFFRLEMVGLSVIIILLLLLLIVVMIWVFYRIRPVAAYLNIPYLLWTAFASYLNIGVLILN